MGKDDSQNTQATAVASLLQRHRNRSQFMEDLQKIQSSGITTIAELLNVIEETPFEDKPQIFTRGRGRSSSSTIVDKEIDLVLGEEDCPEEWRPGVPSEHDFGEMIFEASGSF